MKKYIPNILSAARIFMAVALVFTESFACLYYMCGITDIADGFFARKFNAATSFGSRLDSLADFVFAAACFAKFYKVPDFMMWVWIFAIAAVKIISFAVMKCKNADNEIFHTLPNRLTGILIFALLPFSGYKPIAVLLCGVASAAAIYEFCDSMYQVT